MARRGKRKQMWKMPERIGQSGRTLYKNLFWAFSKNRDNWEAQSASKKSKGCSCKFGSHQYRSRP